MVNSGIKLLKCFRANISSMMDMNSVRAVIADLTAQGERLVHSFPDVQLSRKHLRGGQSTAELPPAGRFQRRRRRCGSFGD